MVDRTTLSALMMDAFRAIGNVSKERKCLLKTVRTPDIVERVRVSIQTCMCNNSYPLTKKGILTTCDFHKMEPQSSPPSRVSMGVLRSHSSDFILS
ncbi:hypothetical protein TNCV_2140441 [Trichonephila clavipes]|uniref:Uncharacterized protein n=1 Tax=Trichonephila clavipes TaxID=2585209 RepID=A0A8X6VC21_TRICX|nr:hypothetical protein TNCV_2140441 [Trichonephila clavipes]